MKHLVETIKAQLSQGKTVVAIKQWLKLQGVPSKTISGAVAKALSEKIQEKKGTTGRQVFTGQVQFDSSWLLAVTVVICLIVVIALALLLFPSL